MEPFFSGFSPAAILLAFFGGIALLMWVEHVSKVKSKEQENTVRLKALELGSPLPDAEIARANAERSRARALGLIGVFAPLFVMGAAVAGTALLLSQDQATWQQPTLYAVWGVCGLVSFLSVKLSLNGLRYRPRKADRPDLIPVDGRGTSPGNV